MNHIVFDLETTCWDGTALAAQRETIEIGAYKLNPLGEVLDDFQCYVKPILAPSLSVYCKNLTRIKQDDIDRAREFPEAITDFLSWSEDVDVYIAWGKYDRLILMDDCRLHRISSEWIDSSYLDLKKAYRQKKGYRHSINLMKAAEKEFDGFEGEAHEALTDAYNLMKIYRKYMGEWGV